jgi:murein DD-endopeptidase MepM/ murein hydrolase activator NlpD
MFQQMKLIFVNEKLGVSRAILFRGWLKGLLSLCLLGTTIPVAYYIFQEHTSESPTFSDLASDIDLQKRLLEQADRIGFLQQKSNNEINALTERLGALQARLSRLDSLGIRITELANLDDGEFDFNEKLPVGGPSFSFSDSSLLSLISNDYRTADKAISDLTIQLEDREHQLLLLKDFLDRRETFNNAEVFGQPLEYSWVASRFGNRPDPFTGENSFHSGIDLTTGKAGAEIKTIASGVVTWAGPRSGYGLMVEVNHGNGFVTRYAHSEKLLVAIGDVVTKSQKIAHVGSTGRSTGPHVHFEVYKNGRIVDPAAYLSNTIR